MTVVTSRDVLFTEPVTIDRFGNVVVGTNAAHVFLDTLQDFYPIEPPTFFKRPALDFGLYIERLDAFYKDMYDTWDQILLDEEGAGFTTDAPEFFALSTSVLSGLPTGIMSQGGSTGTSQSSMVILHPNAPADVTDPESGWVEGRYIQYGDTDSDEVLPSSTKVAYRKKIVPLAPVLDEDDDPVLDNNGRTVRQQSLTGAGVNFTTYYTDLRIAEEKVEQFKSPTIDATRNNFTTQEAQAAPDADKLSKFGIGFERAVIDEDTKQGQGVPFSGGAMSNITLGAAAKDVMWGCGAHELQLDAMLEGLRPSDYWYLWQQGDSRLYLIDMLRVKRDDSGENAIYNALTLRDMSGAPIPIKAVRPLSWDIDIGSVNTASPHVYRVSHQWMHVLATDGKIYTVGAHGIATGRIKPVLAGSSSASDTVSLNSKDIRPFADSGDASSFNRPYHILIGSSAIAYSLPRLGENWWEPTFPSSAVSEALTASGAINYANNSRLNFWATSGLKHESTIQPSPEEFDVSVTEKDYANVYANNFPAASVNQAGQKTGYAAAIEGNAREFWIFTQAQASNTPGDGWVEDTHWRMGSFANRFLPDNGLINGCPGIQTTWSIVPLIFQPIIRIPNSVNWGTQIGGASEDRDSMLHEDLGYFDPFNSLVHAKKDADKSGGLIVFGKPRVTQSEFVSEFGSDYSKAIPFENEPSEETLDDNGIEDIADFDIVFAGIKSHTFSSSTSDVTLSDPLELAKPAIDQDDGRLDQTTLSGIDGVVNLVVDRTARGRFTITVKDEFELNQPVVSGIGFDTSGSSETLGDPIFSVGNRTDSQTWRIFERTWPVNAGDKLQPISGTALPQSSTLSGFLAPEEFPEPYDQRAHLDILGQGLTSFSTVTGFKKVGGAFMLKATSSDDTVVRMRNDISGIRIDTPPSTAVGSGDPFVFQTDERGVNWYGQVALYDGPDEADFLGSVYSRMECIDVGKATITVQDVGADDPSSTQYEFDIYTWKIKDLPSLSLSDVATTALEIDGIASLPITWEVSDSEVGSIAVDGADPKKATFTPKRATVADETISIKATDFNEGWFKIRNLTVG